MTFIQTTSARDAEGDVRAMYQRQQDHWGYVPNYAKAFSRRPEVLARWGRLLAEIRRPMDDRLFELVTFAAAVELKHTACSLAHGKALAEFLSLEEVTRLGSGDGVAALSEADQVAVEFARKIARDALQVTAEDVAGLKAHGLDDETIFDIVAAVAGRAFFTKLLDGLGVQADSPYLELPPSFREPLMVGRPLSTEPAERLESPAP